MSRRAWTLIGAVLLCASLATGAIGGVYLADHFHFREEAEAYAAEKSGIVKLTAPYEAQAGDHFGRSVSTSQDGSYVIVGAPFGEVDQKNSAGAAYVFHGADDGWSQSEVLTAPDAEAGDHFGSSVSINRDGTYAIVGASFGTDIDPGLDAGAAYIFHRSYDGWTVVKKLSAPDARAGDGFGSAVSMSDDGCHVVVGVENRADILRAERKGAKGPNSGAAYVYKRTAGKWSQCEKLIAPDAQTHDHFGNSVSISGDGKYVIVGADDKDEMSSDAGAAYVFLAK